ncbi:MAG: S24 family peptidase [Peptococcaceae bacterium]|nr:S24 family peptidase [Peptococcaceae bacterium]
MTNNLGNKETMSENIKYYMDLHGVDRKTICTALGVNYATFSDWVNARTYPRIDKIELMAHYFGISKADLVEPRDPRKQNIAKSKLYPIVGTIAAGAPILADQNIENYIELNFDIKADFALKVQGDSMVDANIYDGDIVFIRQQPTVENGEIAAVMLIDSDTSDAKATLKRVYKTDEGLTLLSENKVKAYPPIIINKDTCDGAKILGKAVKYITDVR